MNWYCFKKRNESKSTHPTLHGLRSDELSHRHQANMQIHYAHRGPNKSNVGIYPSFSPNSPAFSVIHPPRSVNWKTRHCPVKDRFSRLNQNRAEDLPLNRKETDSGYLGNQRYNNELNQKFTDKFLNSEEPSLQTSSQSSNCQFPMRLLWLRTAHLLQPKVSALLNRFDSEGLIIHIVESVDTDCVLEQSTPCELIVLECIDTGEQDLVSLLYDVRMQSRVPLIVLTDNLTLDWSLLALREGADAIFTLNTPDDIIIARSNALLRRWATE